MISLLFKGALITLQLSVLSLSVGFFLGTLIGILNCDKYRIPIVSHFLLFFVLLIRGTPLFVQVLLIYFGISQSLNIDLSPLTAGVITLGLNSSAYVAETIRGGINSIALYQWEAASSLGYSKQQSWISIILPQALRTILPALTNEITTLIKETSILMIIGVAELTKVGRDIVSRNLHPTETYLLVALIYFCMTSVVSLISNQIEKRLKK